jgi:heme A synthase
MAHRVAGVLVGLLVIAVGIAAFRSLRGRARLLAVVAPLLIAVQVTLGVLSITTFRAVPIVVAHLGVGALLWVLLTLLWLAASPGTAARAEPRRLPRIHDRFQEAAGS